MKILLFLFMFGGEEKSPIKEGGNRGPIITDQFALYYQMLKELSFKINYL